MEREEKKFHYIVIDANNLFYRVALDSIKTENISQLYDDVIGKPIISFFERIETLQNRYAYDTSEIYLLFDNPGSVFYKRREIDSSYKHKREQIRLNLLFLSIINLIKQISLSYSDSYRTLQVDNYEADDLVKPLISCFNLSFYKNCLLISNDLDWSRAMSDYTYWYNHKKLYDKDFFQKKYGFVPSEESVIIWKAIIGDSSDCIEPGLKNIPKDVVQYIVKTYTSVEDLLSHSQKDPNINKHWKEKIIENSDRLRLNAQLVGFVPFQEDIQTYIRRGKKDEGMMNLYFALLNQEEKMKEFRSFNEEDFFAGPILL